MKLTDPYSPGGWPGAGTDERSAVLSRRRQGRTIVHSGRVANCLILAILLATGCDRPTKPTVQAERGLNSEQEFRDKLAELKMQREKSSRAVARLEERKAATVAFLKDKGVKSAADVAEDTNLKYAARELKGWTEEIDKLQQELGHYDQAIKAIETMLSELERKRISETVALSEEEYLKLRKIVLDLNDRLDVDKQDLIADEELDNLLREELGDGGAGGSKQ
jgi:hypothetical protein